MNSTPTQSETLDPVAHLWPTDSLATAARGSNPRKADVRGILKRKNKNGGYSYRAQVRLNDGMPPQSKTFPTLPEARAWKTQEEAKRRQGMYLPSMTSKHKTLGELIDRYIALVLPSKPKNASNTSQHLSWWKKQLGDLSLNRLTSDVIATTRNRLLDNITRRGTKLSPKTANRYLASLSVCLTYGIEECGWLHSNSALNVTKFNEGPARNRLPTPEEIDRLLAACKKSKCKVLYPNDFTFSDILKINKNDLREALTSPERPHQFYRDIREKSKPKNGVSSHDVTWLNLPTDFLLNHKEQPQSKAFESQRLPCKAVEVNHKMILISQPLARGIELLGEFS